MIKHGNSITRGKRLGFEHPSGNFELVEYYLSIDGRSQGWVHKQDIRTAYFMQLLWDTSHMTRSNHIRADFLKHHGFKIPNETPIDIFGYAYLSKEDEKAFWDKFNKGHV